MYVVCIEILETYFEHSCLIQCLTTALDGNVTIYTHHSHKSTFSSCRTVPLFIHTPLRQSPCLFIIAKIKGQDYGSCVLPFLSLSSIYKPSFISIPFVLFRIWPRKATILRIWLRSDNSINIQGRIMVLGFCPSSHCHLSINQVLFQSLLYFPRYDPDRNPL